MMGIRNCIYCNNKILNNFKLFCNIKCKDRFLIIDYKEHPINKSSPIIPMTTLPQNDYNRDQSEWLQDRNKHGDF